MYLGDELEDSRKGECTNPVLARTTVPFVFKPETWIYSQVDHKGRKDYGWAMDEKGCEEPCSGVVQYHTAFLGVVCPIILKFWSIGGGCFMRVILPDLQRDVRLRSR
jgi:hypothetical protein